MRGTRHIPFLFTLLASVAASPAAAQEATTFVETFETGTNEGGWVFGTGTHLSTEGLGNPGACLRDATLMTFGPQASTSPGVESVFTGDWAATGVRSVGIDLATLWAQYPVGPRTLTLILMNDNGTPFDLTDDWGAYLVSDKPVPPSGIAGLAPMSTLAVTSDATTTAAMLQWVSYDFDIPSDSGRLPEGWQWMSRGAGRPAGAWARLMRSVSRVAFAQYDPALRYPFFDYDVVLDNPRITRAPSP